jgi:hypothetical protein
MSRDPLDYWEPEQADQDRLRDERADWDEHLREWEQTERERVEEHE